MTRTFISYRRDDARGSAGRIYDRLADYYGDERVFRDIDTVDRGADFVEVVERAIALSDVMLVLIGPDWLNATDDHGNVRIEDPHDLVRTEVTLGLSQDRLKVIPVIVNGAKRPKVGDLPNPLRPLAFRHGPEIREERFDDDVHDIIVNGIGGRPRFKMWARLHRLTILASATLAAVLVAGVVLLAISLRGESIRQLEGAFNVAIAGFSASGATDADDAERLAMTVHRDVELTLAEYEDAGVVANIEVGGPAQTGSVSATTSAARAEQARSLATALEADVLFYGNIEASSTKTQFIAEFYILPDFNLQHAPELGGEYQIALVELPTTDRVAVEREVTSVLRAQTIALAELVVGMSYYSVNDWSAAKDHLLLAENAWFVPDSEAGEASGKAVVLHLLGNTTGQQGRESLAEARNYYEQALLIDPGYARSKFGLAEVQFLESCGPTQATTDVDRLEDAIRQFREIANSEVPARSDLDIRADFEIGRIYLCMSNAGLDRMEEAKTEFEAVAAIHDSGEELSSDLASESHQALGFYYVLEEEFEAALLEYDRAIDLTLDTKRKAAFHSSKGDIYQCHLGEVELARQEYEIAASLVDDPPAVADC